MPGNATYPIRPPGSSRPDGSCDGPAVSDAVFFPVGGGTKRECPLTSSSPRTTVIAEYVSLGVTAADAVFSARCRIAGQFSLARLTA